MFEPQFYIEVLPLPRRNVIKHFIIMLLFFSVLISGANTWYIIDVKKGIPQTLAAAFPGMEIRDGILHPPSELPYIPPAYLITPVLNQLLGLPAMFNHEADSLVIVDTAAHSTVSTNVPVVLLKANKMVVHLNAGTVMEFSYENIMFGKKDLIFTAEQIGHFLKKHALGIFFGYFISSVVHLSILFFFSIFFLGLAAYIFRLERQRTLKEYLKISFFAITPIAVGNTLVAFSGVKVEWSWHVLILLSTIVMFRAILTISNFNKGIQGVEK